MALVKSERPSATLRRNSDRQPVFRRETFVVRKSERKVFAFLSNAHTMNNRYRYKVHAFRLNAFGIFLLELERIKLRTHSKEEF